MQFIYNMCAKESMQNNLPIINKKGIFFYKMWVKFQQNIYLFQNQNTKLHKHNNTF